jgi:dihydrofolate reductase
MIGGGQQIYELFLPLADRIHLTEIHATFGGDRHFPHVSGRDFVVMASEPIRGEVSYTYLTYERRR